MPIQITCPDGSTFDANSVGAGGAGYGETSIGPPNFGAKRVNLCMADVQRTIQEGRAKGIKPFNIYNSASPWDSAQ